MDAGVVARIRQIAWAAAAWTVAAFWLRPGEFRGVHHPTGELRLTLRRDGRFRLRLSIWDPVAGNVAGQRELTGAWRRRGAALVLRAPMRRLGYRVTVGGRIVWQRSDLPTFADGIELRRAGGEAAS